MQDMVLPLIARVLKLRLSLPNSLSDCIKKLHSYALPSEVRSRTQAYWDSSGHRLKDYRDLDQHFAAIVNQTFLQVGPPPRYLFLLPDNPKQRSVSQFTFGENINALDYLPKAFIEFHAWTEDLAILAGGQKKPINQSTKMDQLGDLVPAVGGTIALMGEYQIVEGKTQLVGIEIMQELDLRLSLRQIHKPFPFDQPKGGETNA